MRFLEKVGLMSSFIMRRWVGRHGKLKKMRTKVARKNIKFEKAFAHLGKKYLDSFSRP